MWRIRGSRDFQEEDRTAEHRENVSGNIRRVSVSDSRNNCKVANKQPVNHYLLSVLH